MSKSTRFLAKQIVCASLLLSSTTAFAAIITITGDNFDLSYDDSQTGLALYGTPVYGSGTNNIFFNQIGFDAISSNGEGLVSTASTVTFSLTRNSDTFNFESLTLFEFGTYTLNGPGASVNLTGSMSISTPSGGFGPVVDPLPAIAPNGLLDINDNTGHNWSGGAFADLTVPGLQLFGGIPNSWEDEDTITISINNILEANTTQAGTSAFIQKLQAGQAIQLGVNGIPAMPSVPVPAAIWLMGSGALGLFGFARRKKHNL